MFGTYFYHNVTRSVTAVFGSLFNDIDIIRKDNSGNVLKQERVPIAYGPRQKFLARIDEREDLDDTKVAIKLPRMSFELSGFAYDATRNLSKQCRDILTVEIDTDTNTKTFLYSGTPYNLSYELNIYAKTSDDALQIVEQILPYFKPSITVTIKPISSQPGIIQNVKFILTGVTLNHTYEGDFTQRNVLIYTLTFDAKTMFYGPIGSGEVIKTAIVNLYDFDNPTNLIQGVSYAVDPPTATENDPYDIIVTETFGFDQS